MFETSTSPIQAVMEFYSQLRISSALHIYSSMTRFRHGLSRSRPEFVLDQPIPETSLFLARPSVRSVLCDNWPHILGFSVSYAVVSCVRFHLVWALATSAFDSNPVQISKSTRHRWCRELGMVTVGPGKIWRRKLRRVIRWAIFSFTKKVFRSFLWSWGMLCVLFWQIEFDTIRDRICAKLQVVLY